MRSAAILRFSSKVPGLILNALRVLLRDLQENKIPIFEREGWLCQPSLSKMGILLIRRSLSSMDLSHRRGVSQGQEVLECQAVPFSTPSAFSRDL